MTTVAATINDKSQLPSKVYQDDFSPGRGNALQAAVASVFGFDLADVPNFVVLPEGYELAIQVFCFDNGRFASLKYNLLQDALDADVWKKYEGKLCLLRGKSPRGDFAHVVVARRTKATDENTHMSAFEMVHDPHPDETFLDQSEPFGWCIFFDDAAYENRSKWPELIGRDCKIVETHLREMYGSKFEIQVVEQGSMVTMDFRLDRIRLYVDAETKSTVTEVPIVG
mmetsp:Transcript_6142/g.12677  ORF Transcript_6142/g.12677 Transcript_6142/m.12677 type:complete len:226 (+) Transcript_6142:126-803(+)